MNVPQWYRFESAVSCVQLLLVMALYRAPGTSCWPPSGVGQDHSWSAPQVCVHQSHIRCLSLPDVLRYIFWKTCMYLCRNTERFQCKKHAQCQTEPHRSEVLFNPQMPLATSLFSSWAVSTSRRLGYVDELGCHLRTSSARRQNSLIKLLW